MWHVEVCLCASTDQESSFHHCGGPVKLVQPCLRAERILQRRFNRRGGAVKHVLACLSASKDEEGSFHYCGSPVMLVQACLWAGSTLQRRFDR